MASLNLQTSTIGSFPKPRTLRRTRWLHAEGEIEERELREAERRATRAVLEQQRALGLDMLVDGQMDRSDMATFFAERLEGVEAGGLVRCYDNRYYRMPRVVDPIERVRALTVDHWKWAQQTAGRAVKAVLTGPYTLMDWSSDEHYGSREECCLAFAQALREEAEELLGAGATEIQIDEPALSVRPEEMELAMEALSRVVAGVRGRARTWLHACYGDFRPVIERIFALPVDGVLLELANSRMSLVDALGALPDDKLFGAGVVDVASPNEESVDEIKRRIERVLRHVPAERLWIVPDTGLRVLTEDQAARKLSAMVEAATALR
jgi:5-methyltetrahydropteroyltriglutamate--homocysteine methyltransferase